MNQTTKTDHDLLAKAVRMMETAIKIPGTNIRFGLDALLGLIPGVGDTVSFGISGALLLLMVKRGVDTSTAMKMLGNILIDYIIGSIPILGDLFDFGFKANRRNLDLLTKYQNQTNTYKKPNVKLMLTLILIALIAFIGLSMFIIFALLDGIGDLFS